MTLNRISFWFGAIVVAAWFLVSPVGAQTPAGRDDPKYRELIRKALEEYERGNLSEAKLLFSDAHSIYPNARTLRGLGLVAYAMRNYVQASDLLEQALSHPAQPLTDELRSNASSVLEQSRHFEAHLDIEVQPRSAEISIDDRPVKYASDGSARVNPGAHEIRAQLSGFEDLTRSVTLDAGDRRSMELALQPAAKPTDTTLATRPLAPPGRPDDPFVTPPRDSKKVALGPWILLGVSAAVAITGGVLIGVALSDVSSLEDPKPRTAWSEVKGTYDSTPALSGIGIAAVGVGVAGAAASLAWMFWPEPERESNVRLSVSPVGLHARISL